mmetsp:Transcript_105486/g.264154  ORF Transcript_105486/g.264154 Transcript_105486/m.264154 type:complete len:582 (-) Transcript_105486:311-2056(-)
MVGAWLVLGLLAGASAGELPAFRQLPQAPPDRQISEQQPSEAPPEEQPSAEQPSKAPISVGVKNLPQDDQLAKLTNSAVDIVGPLVQGFLKKQEMTPEDRQCLVKGSEKFTGNLMLVASHIVMLFQEVMGQRKDVPGLQNLVDVKLEAGNMNKTKVSAAAPTPAQQQPKQQPSPTPSPASSTTGKKTDNSLDYFYGNTQRRLAGEVFKSTGILMHVSAILMEMGTSLQLLVKLSNHIASECVDGEALEALKLAGAHAHDIRYIGGHFLANGADILTEMAEGAVAYKEGKYEEFGSQMGKALRKMLLAKGANSTIPSGVQGKYMMVNMSMGFVKGFFGKGFTLGIKLDQDPKQPLRIDMEDCVANNMAFFEQIWSALAYAYAQKSMAEQVRESGGHMSDQQKQGKVQMGTALAVAAMEFPDALHRCGLGERQADMLIDSVKAFGDGMHLTVSTPNELASNDQIMRNLGRTIDDWKKLNWYGFGFDLGVLLQEMILTFFPKKYTIDSTGGLQQQLSELDGGLPLHGSLGGRLALALLPAALLLSIVAVAAVLGRSHRRLRDVAAVSTADADTESMFPDEAVIE